MFCFMLLGMLMTFPAGYPTAQGENTEFITCQPQFPNPGEIGERINLIVSLPKTKPLASRDWHPRIGAPLLQFSSNATHLYGHIRLSRDFPKILTFTFGNPPFAACTLGPFLVNFSPSAGYPTAQGENTEFITCQPQFPSPGEIGERMNFIVSLPKTKPWASRDWHPRIGAPFLQFSSNATHLYGYIRLSRDFPKFLTFTFGNPPFAACTLGPFLVNFSPSAGYPTAQGENTEFITCQPQFPNPGEIGERMNLIVSLPKTKPLASRDWHPRIGAPLLQFSSNATHLYGHIRLSRDFPKILTFTFGNPPFAACTLGPFLVNFSPSAGYPTAQGENTEFITCQPQFPNPGEIGERMNLIVSLPKTKPWASWDWHPRIGAPLLQFSSNATHLYGHIRLSRDFPKILTFTFGHPPFAACTLGPFLVNYSPSVTFTPSKTSFFLEFIEQISLRCNVDAFPPVQTVVWQCEPAYYVEGCNSEKQNNTDIVLSLKSKSLILANSSVAVTCTANNIRGGDFNTIEIPILSNYSATDGPAFLSTNNFLQLVETSSLPHGSYTTAHRFSPSGQGSDHWTHSIFNHSEIWKLVILIVGIDMVILMIIEGVRYFCQIKWLCRRDLTQGIAERRNVKVDLHKKNDDGSTYSVFYYYASYDGSIASGYYSEGIPESCTWRRDSLGSGSYSSIKETHSVDIASAEDDRDQHSTHPHSGIRHTYFAVNSRCGYSERPVSISE